MVGTKQNTDEETINKIKNIETIFYDAENNRDLIDRDEVLKILELKGGLNNNGN